MGQRLRFFQDKMLRKIFGPEKDEVNRERRRLYRKEIYDLYSSPYVIWVTNSRRMRRAGHIAHMGDRIGANGFWWKNLGDREHSEDLGLYGRITLIWIIWFQQIILMTIEQQQRKS
jgi:hypothetical protein